MGWLEIGLTAADQIGNIANQKLQYERTKKLMEIQQRNQQELNLQGQEIQLDTWEKTNYPAQVGMLKKAGLNPALLYAKGGAGGVTGSQGGGSAAAGTAPNAMPMNISNIMQLKAQQANIKLMESQANLNNVEAGKKAGVDTAEAETRIGKLIAETQNEELKGELIKIQTAGEKIKVSNQQAVTDAELKNVAEATRKLWLDNKLTEDTWDSIVRETAANAFNAELESELKKANIKLTEAHKQAIITGLVQKWTELGLKGRELDYKELEIGIETFKAEISAEYPGIWNVAGMIAKKGFKGLEEFAKMMTQFPYMPNVQNDKIK